MKRAILIAAAGFPLTVWDRNPERAAAFSESGVRVASTNAGLANDVDVVLSCLADDAAVEDVYFGDGGVFRTNGSYHTIIELNIVAPETRDSRLIIQHGTGRLLVSDIAGDVQATSKGGDILRMLSDSAEYSIDARSKLGTVWSDFEGASHHRHIVGSGFERAMPAPAHRIYLRTGIGGITIKAVPAEGATFMTGRNR